MLKSSTSVNDGHLLCELTERLRGKRWKFRTAVTPKRRFWTFWAACVRPAHTLEPAASKSCPREPLSSASRSKPTKSSARSRRKTERIAVSLAFHFLASLWLNAFSGHPLPYYFALQCTLFLNGGSPSLEYCSSRLFFLHTKSSAPGTVG